MDIISILWQSISITLFVLSMMLIIDYLNVLTKGLWSESLQKNRWQQVLLGALLGIIPGCLGAYTAVSLYVHNIFGIGALVAAMIATSGDEAFFMFSIIPKTAVYITVALFFIAIITGFIVNAFTKEKPPTNIKHFDVHENEPECICFDRTHLVAQLKQITTLRLILIVVLLFSLVLILINFENILHSFQHQGHTGEHVDHLHPEWIGVTFAIVLGLSLAIVTTVSDHFLREHLVNHIIKKHFIRIFLWTLGTLLAMHFLTQYISLDEIISDNLYVVLLVAVLVGIIPESGPHLLFIVLFASGTIPASILIANSIVQDGHGSLPLLAESQKGFLKVKLINLAVGFLVGGIGLWFGY